MTRLAVPGLLGARAGWVEWKAANDERSYYPRFREKHILGGFDIIFHMQPQLGI